MSKNRIAIFYDGNYFQNISYDIYKNHNKKLDIIKLNKLIENKINEKNKNQILWEENNKNAGHLNTTLDEATLTNTTRAAAGTKSNLKTFIQKNNADSFFISELHYFRGRFVTNLNFKDQIINDRKFEDILVDSGMSLHYLPMNKNNSEKGIDVWLAIEALELAILNKIEYFVLIGGDSDYLPLFKKLRKYQISIAIVGNNTNCSAKLIAESSIFLNLNPEVSYLGTRIFNYQIWIYDK